jgi:hypothetical protein
VAIRHRPILDGLDARAAPAAPHRKGIEVRAAALIRSSARVETMMARSRRRQILGALSAVATVTLVFGAMKATEGAVEYGVQPTLSDDVSTVLYLAAMPQGQPPQAAEVGLGEAVFKHKR